MCKYRFRTGRRQAGDEPCTDAGGIHERPYAGLAFAAPAPVSGTQNSTALQPRRPRRFQTRGEYRLRLTLPFKLSGHFRSAETEMAPPAGSEHIPLASRGLAHHQGVWELLSPALS